MSRADGIGLIRAALFASVLTLLSVARTAQAGEPLPPPTVKAPTGFWANAAWVCRRIRLRCQTSNAGKLLTNAIRPISKLTGGVIPVPNDNHFAGAVELHATKPAGMAPGATPKPPPPPPPGVAAAAKIKTEKKQSKIRREAVAYLAGLDCRYYPEAEAALIASLRADRDECVRLEAARALLTGCCCTPNVAKALTICVTGSCEDGNPSERSSAVRRTALAALQKCQQCGVGSPVMTQPEPPLGVAPSSGSVLMTSFNDNAAQLPGTEATLAPSEDLARMPDPKRPRSVLSLWRASGDSEQ